VKLISPAFYAMGSSRIPVMASAASVAMNIGLNLILVRSLGHRGLALGTATAALLNAGVLMWSLRKRLGGLDGGRLLTATVKISAASVVMAFAAYYAERFLHVPFSGQDVANQGIRVIGAIVVGMTVLALSTHALGIEEFEQLRRRALRARTW
jgi:putative peptidoglycan lipid II flippase